MKAIFDTDSTLSISKLFNQNVILDLSSIIRLGGEKEDALFFLNMVLKYLWDKNLTKGATNYDGINHITIIEDAQYFAPQDISKKSKLTTYLEDIALLQRGTGECLITIATRPNISKEILANNGVVLTFKNHIEKDIMCELLNLDTEKKNYLSILEEGYCIIRVNSIKEPFLLGIPFIRRDPRNVSDIIKKNRSILANSQKSLDSKTEIVHKPKQIFEKIRSLELDNKEKEDLLLLNKNKSLSKNDYNNFNTLISKLYQDQKKTNKF
jgi:hypothetical protein